jgi:hypothetical protein
MYVPPFVFVPFQVPFLNLKPFERMSAVVAIVLSDEDWFGSSHLSITLNVSLAVSRMSHP